MLLCRGCCCGTSDKHPKVDHDTQERRLETAAGAHPRVALRVVECLDECDRSNVAVLRRTGAPARERDTWLGTSRTRNSGRANNNVVRSDWFHARPARATAAPNTERVNQWYFTGSTS